MNQIQPVYDEDGRLLWNRWSNGLKVFFESENLDVEQGPHGDVRLSVPYDLIRFEPTPEDHALLVKLHQALGVAVGQHFNHVHGHAAVVSGDTQ